MSLSSNQHRRRRLTPAKYQAQVQELAKGREVSSELEIVTPEMEDAAVAVHGLMSVSSPKVKERMRNYLIACSRDREWDVRDQLVQATTSIYGEY